MRIIVFLNKIIEKYMNVWKSIEKGDSKIIAYLNNTIYKGNPKESELESIFRKLKTGDTQNLNLFEINQSVLKEVRLDERKECIQIFFGQTSYEELKVKNKETRNEIYKYLSENIPNSKKITKHYSKIESGKKALYAFFVILIFFIWSSYLALDIENGAEYEVSGSGHSIAGIVLGIGLLGINTILFIFIPLLIISILSFFINTRKPKIVHKTIVIR